MPLRSEAHRLARYNALKYSTALLVIVANFAATSSPAQAQATPDTIASVCSGVSLPPSVVTGIMDPVLTGMVTPIESTVNQALDVIAVVPVVGTTISDLDIDVETLLADAAAGDPVTLAAIASDGSLIGPSDECNATADSYTLDNEAGISIGGNSITGLGANGEEAVAGEIDSIALGNNAETDGTSAASIAIGADASVGANADGSIAFGSGASATEANSVALGAGSVAERGALSDYAAFALIATQDSAGEVSVGAPGAERQITNVAAGSEATDAVNVAQLEAVAALIGDEDAVVYDDPTFTVVTLAGAGGTTITNVAAGSLTPSSTDAVNGSQLYATNQQVASNTTAITNLTNVVNSGANNPVQYSDDATPTVPNGGTPTNDVTLVGGSAGWVQLHNLAAGTDATDAVNLAQLQQVASMIGGGGANAVVYNDSSFTAVTLAGLNGTTINNLAPGALNATSTEAVNGAQLFATNQQVTANSTAITNLSLAISNGAIGPVQYSNDSTPTAPNGGVPTNDLTLVGGSAGPVQLHNVADGVIAPGSTDAINGGQIYELALAVDNSVQYEVDASGNRTNRVVLVGGNASAPVTITNVAAGVNETDAVNVGQLDDAVDHAVTLANTYTDARVQALQFDVRRSQREARAGTAAALAAAGLPQPYEPGKNMFGFGVGTYRGRAALALGASAALEDGQTVMKFGVTYDSSDHVGGNLGVGWQF